MNHWKKISRGLIDSSMGEARDLAILVSHADCFRARHAFLNAWQAWQERLRGMLSPFRTRSLCFTRAYSRVALVPGLFLLKFLRGKPRERDCSPHDQQENHTQRFDLFRFIKRFYSKHSRSCVPWCTSQLRGKGTADLLLYSKSYRQFHQESTLQK